MPGRTRSRPVSPPRPAASGVAHSTGRDTVARIPNIMGEVLPEYATPETVVLTPRMNIEDIDSQNEITFGERATPPEAVDGTMESVRISRAELQRFHESYRIFQDSIRVPIESSTSTIAENEQRGVAPEGSTRSEEKEEGLEEHEVNAEMAPLLAHETCAPSVARSSAAPQEGDPIILPADAYFEDPMWPQYELQARSRRHRQQRDNAARDSNAQPFGHLGTRRDLSARRYSQ